MPSPHHPLRVLQITSTSLLGGAEQMVLTLARHADPARLRVEVLSLMGDGPVPELARQAGTEGTGWGLKRLADPRLLARMRRFLAAGEFDLVHCYGLRAELLTRWVAYGLKQPVISSISSPDPWRRWPHVWLDRLTADGVTAWIAVCEAARQTRIRRERFPADRIHVVYNGIPDRPVPGEAAHQAARAALGLAPSAPVLLIVANLREAKGYPDLIEAVARLRGRFPDLVCLCAGSDGSAGRIPALAEARGVGGAMRWLGFVDGTEELLAAADLAVLSSHWEGCPVNLIEAMRAGRAMVATRVGGIPEMIEDGREGLLIEPHAPEALAGAIARLLEDPAQRDACARAARKTYLERFTVEEMVERLTDLYERYAGRIGADQAL